MERFDVVLDEIRFVFDFARALVEEDELKCQSFKGFNQMLGIKKVNKNTNYYESYSPTKSPSKSPSKSPG